MKHRPLTVRIVGGQYRGRLIRFADLPGLRPTPDRVRETLFNWLGQDLAGRDCLDLYAGSGALGLEAASRHARSVTLVEHSRAAARLIGEAVQMLSCTNVTLHCAEALACVEGFIRAGRRFDVVFLDPPFGSDALAVLAPHLPALLRPEGLVYVESERPFVAVPPLEIRRQGRAGAVHYALAGYRVLDDPLPGA